MILPFFLLYNSMVYFSLGHSFVYPYLFTLHLSFFFFSDCLLLKIALTYIKYS